MYLSKKYKLLVLRTPKTGSSSLSEFLIKNIDDPDAIYTEIDDSGIPGTLNEHIVNRNRPFKYFHFTLNDLIREGVITPDIIMNYRCISVLRNPVDRQKSFYYFMKKFWAPNTVATLEEYKRFSPDGYSLRREYNTMLKQTDLLMYEGKLRGEFWLYENLETELYKLMKDLNIEVWPAEGKYPLQRHKSGFRKDRHAEIEFDDEVMNSLRNHFKLDFETYEKLSR